MKKTLIIVALITLTTLSLYTDEIDDFERIIREKPDYDTESEYDSGDSCASEACGEFTGALCTAILTSSNDENSGSDYNRDEIQIEREETITDREPDSTDTALVFDREAGDFLGPIFRVDSNYSYISNNMYSINNRAEVGYTNYAFSIEYNQYNVISTNNKLHQFSLLFHLRLQITDILEVNPSVGYQSLQNKNLTDGWKTGVVIRFSPSKYFGFEIRPYAITNDLYYTRYDIDASIYAGPKFWGVTLGYKFLGNNRVNFQGFYTGLRFFY